MEAIILHEGCQDKKQKTYARINPEDCVECSVCVRASVCPTDAIKEQELEWPRILRKAFSDPLYVHKGTDVPGRGTEEMKTNDVTGRYPDGWIGIGMEFGRPGIGTRFRDVEKATRKLAELGVALEPLNPLTQLIENEKTGELKIGILDEKVLSTIVEFVIPIDRVKHILTEILRLSDKIETVFSLDLICKVEPDGHIPLLKELEVSGLGSSINGKVNLGLGRPVYKG
jgi:ferredoxin